MFGKEADYTPKSIEQGQVIIKEGDIVNKLYIVQSGEVACVTISNDRVIPIYTVQNSGVIGEDGVFSEDRPSSYSAIAMTKVSVVEIPKKDIMKFVKASSDWVKNILFDISDKVARTTDVIAEHRIIDDRFNGGKLFTDQEEILIKKSLEEKKEKKPKA